MTDYGPIYADAEKAAEVAEIAQEEAEKKEKIFIRAEELAERWRKEIEINRNNKCSKKIINNSVKEFSNSSVKSEILGEESKSLGEKAEILSKRAKSAEKRADARLDAIENRAYARKQCGNL